MRNVVLSFAIAIASISSASNAAVVGGAITGGTVFRAGGTFRIIPPPPATGFDNFNDNNLRAFNEVQNFALASALTLDANASPVIPARTVINSHLIVFDPPGAQRDAFQPTLAGYVDFDAPILGVIWRSTTLTATNALLGATGVRYLTPAGYGLESGSDFFTIAPSGNANRIAINFFSATSPGDEMRVITGRRVVAPVVPEPATWLSMVVGFGIAGSFLRRRISRAQIA
jgi:PEP-CTERM motif